VLSTWLLGWESDNGLACTAGMGLLTAVENVLQNLLNTSELLGVDFLEWEHNDNNKF